MKQYNKSVRGKLFHYFQQRLKIRKSTKGWYRCDCVFCGGDYTFAIHLTERKARCFKCGESYSPIKLLMELEKLETFNQAYAFLNSKEEFEAYDEEVVKRPEVKPIYLPESFKLVGRVKKSILGKISLNYLLGRGFTLEQLTMWGVGYCTTGPYSGYIVFPFYQRGQLKFFQGRRFTSVGTKMKNPNEEDFGIGKSELIYNEDALYTYRKINLVESITNAITLGDNTIAILGKSISPYQFYRILNSPVEMINIILDRDALDKAIHLAMSLCNFKKVKITIMPNEKDVNDLGRKKTLELSRKSDWGTYNTFLKMKIEYEQNTQFTHN